MNRLVACFLLSGVLLPFGLARAADEPKPDNAETKAPVIKLDAPSSVDVVVGNKATLEVKVDREHYDGPVSVKLSGIPGQRAAEKSVPKGETAKFEFVLTREEKDKVKLKVEAVGGGATAEPAEVEVAYRKPDPVGDGPGDAAAIGAPAPDKGKYKIKEVDLKKPDTAALVENQNAQQQAILDLVDYSGKVAEYSTKTRFGTNMLWTLLGGFLVMFMMAGFAMVETGLVRSKNVAHTMAMNLLVYGIGMLGFFAVGFGLMFGGTGVAGGGVWGGAKLLDSEFTVSLFGKDWGLFGFDGFFLTGRAFDTTVMCLFLFQMVFMDTTATIPTGAMAERWKFSAFALFTVVMSTLIYPMYGNWVWGGGWLAGLGTNAHLGHGHVDFAGSSVVHMTGGLAALAGVAILGPRIGKYNKDGSVNALPAHNVPMYVLGTMILAFGWFGFNPGSALQLGNDFIAARVAVNTMLASATGMVGATFYVWAVYKKPDPSFMCNGMLAGLVAITAPCAFVTPGWACLIGAVAGVLMVWSVYFWEHIVKLDDPVGALSVHGVNGAWGVLSLGLFADGTYGKGLNNVHLFRDSTSVLHWVEDLTSVPKDWVEVGVTGLLYGNSSQFYAEAIGVAANVLWVLPLSLLAYSVIGVVWGNRSKPEHEALGLDIPEMGVPGYINDASVTPEGHTTAAPREPREAFAANGEGRFNILIQGLDEDTIAKTWSELCLPGRAAPPKEFLIVYPNMTTCKGTRFSFRGGDPEQVRASLGRLLGTRTGKAVRAILE